MIVIISDRAERDFATQIQWLHDRSPKAGERAARRILDVIDLLEQFPDLGERLRGTIREKHVKFGKDGFVIRYRRGETTIIVMRIFHSRQDRPGFP